MSSKSPQAAPSGIRLQKIIATAGIASRRAAEGLIRDGRVMVNGKLVTELGTRADPEVDEIKVDGRRLGRAGRRRYLLLNKPRGGVFRHVNLLVPPAHPDADAGFTIMKPEFTPLM